LPVVTSSRTRDVPSSLLPLAEIFGELLVLLALVANWHRAGLMSLATPWKALLLAGVTMAILSEVGIHLRTRTHATVSPALPRQIAFALAYVLIGLLFIQTKRLLNITEMPRSYYDTYSYVAVAEKPLTSADFWFAERSFTLPLFYKILGVTTQNYQDAGVMARVAKVQFWFAAFAWLTLAAACAMALRRSYLSWIAFGSVLAFALSIDISLWDYLLLSESLSFSLFALVLASWLGLLMLTLRKTPLRRWLPAYLAWLMVVSALYSFARDANLYFVCLGTVLLALLGLLERKKIQLLWPYMALLVFAGLLFFIQNDSIHRGNRWQIHIYDNLKVRIMPDDQARNYFIAAGLPMPARFLEVQALSQREYQLAMFHDPALQPVREWVNNAGQSTYIRYLLSRPLQSLWQPLTQMQHLLNGDNQEYRNPIGEVPRRILILSNLVYNRHPLYVEVLFLIALGYLIRGWKQKGSDPLYAVILILTISLYPLMFIVWHGNPLEVERHAAQIGVQLRLAGWLAALSWLAGCRQRLADKAPLAG